MPAKHQPDFGAISAFKQRVYAVVAHIPRGCVSTYAEVAAAIGCGSPRAVGQALKRNPFAPRVPCHRVIASDLTIGGFAGHRQGKEIARKLRLLAQEGVEFRKGRLAQAARVRRADDLAGRAGAATTRSMNTTELAQYREWDREALWHPYTRAAAQDAGLPLLVRGEGVYLFDAEGRRYFDAIASWWACSLGHGHPRLVEAIVRQAQELQHSILGNLSHPRAVELAHRLRSLVGGDRRVFFGSDGASAVEAALKIAVQYWYNRGKPERCRFATLQGGYHGDTLGAVSVGFVPEFHAPFRPVVFPVFQAEAPCCGTCGFGRAPETCTLECFRSMEAILDRHARELAAVIVEPLCQGAAGMRIYSPRYLTRLANVCAASGVLLIADEVATGFGRTGRMFAFEHAGIAPDIVCLGKSLSGGYLPISATVVARRICEAFGDTPDDHTFYHGHTFAGNPIAAACALAALDVYREERIAERAARLGEILTHELNPLLNERGVRDVRCLGLIGAVELADDGPTSGAQRAQQVRATLLDQGILLRPLGNVVYLMPPLTTPEPALREAAVRVRQAIAERT